MTHLVEDTMIHQEEDTMTLLEEDPVGGITDKMTTREEDHKKDDKKAHQDKQSSISQKHR